MSLKKFKRGIESLFHPCVNAIEWWPYWLSCMKVSYCTLGFGTIITEKKPLCKRVGVQAGKATHACLVGLATKKCGST